MDGDITRKPPLFIRIIGFIILFSIGFFIKDYFFETNEKNNNELIQKQLDGLNKTLPMVINSSLRADTVFMLKDDGFKYCFTLTDVDNKTSKVYIDALKYKLKASCQEYYDTNDGMGPFRDINAKLNYYYKDKNGYYLFDFTIRPTKK